MNWYVQVLRKYAVFSGRARRKEYWMFFLVNVLIIAAIRLIEGATGLEDAVTGNPLSSLYSLAVLLPSIGVAIRRLHDTGRSGWWLLIGLVPVVGAVVILIFMAMEGTPGDNAYGENPKAVIGG